MKHLEIKDTIRLKSVNQHFEPMDVALVCSIYLLHSKDRKKDFLTLG